MRDLKELLENLNLDFSQMKEEASFIAGIEEAANTNITGADNVSTSKHRIFTNRFSKEYIQLLKKHFTRLSPNEMNATKIKFLLDDIEQTSREMKKNGEYPLEAILYASKEINGIIENNDLLIDQLGDVIKDIYDASPIRNKEAAIYILNNWSWIPQLNILVNAVGKLDDKELLDEAIKLKDSRNKFEVFKALINSGMKESVVDILKRVTLLEWENQDDNKIVKMFRNYYEVKFGRYGIDQAMEYEKLPNISHRGKIVLADMVMNHKEGGDNNGQVDIGDIKKLIQDNKFDRVKKLMFEKKTRRNCFVAIRASNIKDEIAKVWRAMIVGALEDEGLATHEVAEGLLALAKRGGAEEVTRLAPKYIVKKIAVDEAYCALAMIGNPIYIDKVVDEVFNLNLKMYRLLKHCKNQVESKIIQRINENMFSSSKKLVSNTINVSTELVHQKAFNFAKIYPRNLAKLINGDSRVLEDDNLRMEIIKSIEVLCDDKTANDFMDTLFKISENPGATEKEKFYVDKILLKVKIAPPQ